MEKKFIRKKVQDLLKNDPRLNSELHLNGDVFTRKSTANDDRSLPLINVYPNSEPSERFDNYPKRYRRNLEIIIEYISSHDNDELLADELDLAAEIIEDLIELDEEIQGYKNIKGLKTCIEQFELIGTDYDQEGEGSSPFGSVRLTYRCQYIKDAKVKSLNNSFNTVESEWNIGDHLENKAVDNFEIPQE